MSGPILGHLSNIRWSRGTVLDQILTWPKSIWLPKIVINSITGIMITKFQEYENDSENNTRMINDCQISM